MDRIHKQPEDLQLFEIIDKTLEIIKPLSLSLDLWKAQNSYFSLGDNIYSTMNDKAEEGDRFACSWVENFLKLGYFLNVKI
jgi:flagellin-specific chaperone FliS